MKFPHMQSTLGAGDALRTWICQAGLTHKYAVHMHLADSTQYLLGGPEEPIAPETKLAPRSTGPSRPSPPGHL